MIALRDLLAVTYFDEGVFGGVPPSQEGIAFFSFDGQFVYGYQSLMAGAAVDIADCYCASRVDHETLAFSAYTGFELVKLQPHIRTQTVDRLPKALHGASALSISRESAFLFAPYQERSVLFRWRSGERPEEIGRFSGRLRGLEQGRFLAPGKHGFAIMKYPG